MYAEAVVQGEGREVGEDQVMQCPGAMPGLWSVLNRRFVVLGRLL